jgi:3-methyladenine DNA glycosylase AlkD
LSTISDIKHSLESYHDFQKAEKAPKFFQAHKGGYGEGDQFLGVAVPDQRKVAKKFWKEISSKELESLLNDPIHEVRLSAIFMLVEKYKKAKKEEKQFWVDMYLKNLNGVNNWDLVDSSADKILGNWLLDKDRTLLYDLANSGDLWRERISIVATYEFIRKGDYEDTYKIAEILLNHPHDLIHKAVGWMLKEMGKRSPEAEEVFLVKFYEKMPRTMLRYAVEKMGEKRRQAYLKGTI